MPQLLKRMKKISVNQYTVISKWKNGGSREYVMAQIFFLRMRRYMIICICMLITNIFKKNNGMKMKTK